MKNKEIVAFFDIDGTIYRDSLLIEMFKLMVKYGIIEEKVWVNNVKPKFVKWDNRKGDYEAYILELAKIYKNNIKGLNQNILKFLAEQIISSKGFRVYHYTRKRILWHQKQGHKVITISGSPHILVEEFAKLYGFDDYIGSKYLINKNDKFTSEVLPMWDNKHKENALKDFVEKYDLDLENSYAYGDTAGDISMLKLVGKPFAINPSSELIDIISNENTLKDKINIIIERKDVVYNLPFESLNYSSFNKKDSEF